MQALSTLVKMIVVTALMEAVAAMLMPKGSMRKYVRFIGGVILVCLLAETLVPMAKDMGVAGPDGAVSAVTQDTGVTPDDYLHIYDQFNPLKKE